MKKIVLLMITWLLLASTSHAYYQAEQGRWLNRDPVGEKGGVNLYGFVRNDAADNADYLGWCHWVLDKIVEKNSVTTKGWEQTVITVRTGEFSEKPDEGECPSDCKGKQDQVLTVVIKKYCIGQFACADMKGSGFLQSLSDQTSIYQDSQHAQDLANELLDNVNRDLND